MISHLLFSGRDYVELILTSFLGNRELKRVEVREFSFMPICLPLETLEKGGLEGLDVWR